MFVFLPIDSVHLRKEWGVAMVLTTELRTLLLPNQGPHLLAVTVYGNVVTCYKIVIIVTENP